MARRCIIKLTAFTSLSPSLAAKDLTFPSAAVVKAVNGTLFRTNVRILNPPVASNTVVHVQFFPLGTDNSVAPSPGAPGRLVPAFQSSEAVTTGTVLQRSNSGANGTPMDGVVHVQSGSGSHEEPLSPVPATRLTVHGRRARIR